MTGRIVLQCLTTSLLLLGCGSTMLLAADERSAVAPGSPFNSTGSGLGNSGLNSVLPADQAFAFSALIEAPSTLVLLWDIADNYYLYRDSLSFNIQGQAQPQAVQLPAGEVTEDEFFGASEVYYERLLVRIPLGNDVLAQDRVDMEVTYQGCAAARYCYPMQHKAVNLELLQNE